MSENDLAEDWISNTPRFLEIQDNLVNQLYEALRDNWGVVASSQLKRLAHSFEHHTRAKAGSLSEYIQIFRQKIETHGKSLNLDVMSNIQEQPKGFLEVDNAPIWVSNPTVESYSLTEAYPQQQQQQQPTSKVNSTINAPLSTADSDLWSTSGPLVDFSERSLSNTDDKLNIRDQHESPDSDMFLLDYLMGWPDLMYQYNESLSFAPDNIWRQNSGKSKEP